MVPNSTSLIIDNVDEFVPQLLNWADQFQNICFLSNNDHLSPYSKYEIILGIDALDSFEFFSSEDLSKFEIWKNNKSNTIFGYFTYELNHKSLINIDSNESLAYFFEPRYIVELNNSILTLNRNYPETIEWLDMVKNYKKKNIVIKSDIELKCTTTKEDYIHNIDLIKKQIEEGTYYEINYCIEFKAINATINPIDKFIHLNNLSKAPFSALYKREDKYILCASPERFLARRGAKLISQPIKGTSKRDHKNSSLDKANKNNLFNSIKERAENVMIVDLVRNDLTPYAKTGSIQVEELFGIYSFEHVHQMISTISCILEHPQNSLKALINAFPPGSMTGAPKVEVMKHINNLENMKRDIYSGSIGYFLPEGDFDFNVVIRSVFYDSHNKIISIKAGSAITYDSIPEREYEECFTKAESLIKVIRNSNS